ncbi:proepiregulin [Discoglossus pictus]
MDFIWRCTSLLLLFGFQMFQMVCGTTVIPLCKSDENCTTAMVKTTNSPRVAPVKLAKCAPHMDSYCWNGQCMYIVELEEHYCKCDTGYRGLRCVDSELSIQPMSQEYVALTIFVTVLLLLAIAIASFFAYKWYKNKKLRQPSNEYKEVITVNL